MSEYFFGLGTGRISTREAKRIRGAIKAANESCRVDFVTCDIPGDGPRYWFAATDRGNPFNARIAMRINAAVGQIKTLQLNA